MRIDLNEKINEQLQRLEVLAEEAADDDSESYSSRASAMRALSMSLNDLVKTQAEVVNMERLMRIESITIETLRKFLPEKDFDQYMSELETTLRA